jgi:hypothetical protein
MKNLTKILVIIGSGTFLMGADIQAIYSAELSFSEDISSNQNVQSPISLEMLGRVRASLRKINECGDSLKKINSSSRQIIPLWKGRILGVITGAVMERVFQGFAKKGKITWRITALSAIVGGVLFDLLTRKFNAQIIRKDQGQIIQKIGDMKTEIQNLREIPELKNTRLHHALEEMNKDFIKTKEYFLKGTANIQVGEKLEKRWGIKKIKNNGISHLAVLLDDLSLIGDKAQLLYQLGLYYI